MEEKAKKQINPALIQAIKAVAVLVIICLVCVLLLALCNDLLYVSSEEKFNRTIRKVWDGYGANVKFTEETVNSEFKSNSNYGEVLEVRSASDGSYVITSKGTVGAFNGGSVTILVAIGPNPEAKILGWALQDNEGQTFIANITDKHQKEWFVGSTVSDVQATVTPNAGQGKGSGATYTENALANAINMACYYCQNALGLGANPEGDARKAVLALLGDEYADYTFTRVTDADDFAEFAVGEQTLTYYFEGSKEGETNLEAFVYGQDENRQIVVVKSGLTHAERLAQDVVATNASDEIVEKVKSLNCFEYLVHKYYDGFMYDGMADIDSSFTSDKGTVNNVYTSTDGSVVIEVTGNGGYESGTVTINVIIFDGTIKGWWIVSSEKQSFIDNITGAWDTAKNWYVGSSIDADIELGNNKVTGTTMSSTAINNAINTACSYARSLAD